jgi:hypothetical protein
MHLPLIIVPNAGTGSRIHRAHAQHEFQSSGLEDAALGVDERDALSLELEAGTQFLRCQDITNCKPFDVIGSR